MNFQNTSQNTLLTLGIQATVELNVMNKDKINRDKIITSRFAHSPPLKCHHIIFLSKS